MYNMNKINMFQDVSSMNSMYIQNLRHLPIVGGGGWMGTPGR